MIKNNTAVSRVLLFVFFVLYLIALVRTAWISDDAAITLRTVLNFVNGFGPTFNLDERVQAYTHPLWFLIISAVSLIFHNIFTVTFVISILFSLASVWLAMVLFGKKPLALIMVGLAVLLSKSFVDYSTSGLENPLSHFLCFFAVYLFLNIEKSKDNQGWFFLVCSLIYLSRPDLLLIVFPAAIYVLVAHGRLNKGAIKILALSASPVLVWTLFSVAYYGFPFPNTAYAKLGNGIEFSQRVAQGVNYYLEIFKSDPVVLPIISVSLVVGFLGSVKTRLVALGIAFYLLYVLYIGGDFMSGRFFTTPYFISLLMLTFSGDLVVLAIISLTLVLGIGNVRPNFLAGGLYGNKHIGSDGIADERGYYYQKTGYLSHGEWLKQRPLWTLGEKTVNVTCTLGFQSIKAGPSAHFVDDCALADPLLSRLPSKYNEKWRVGHYYRQIPTNYIESLEQDKNLLLDQDLARYWDAISVITKGELWSVDRFKTILQINASHELPFDYSKYRFSPILRTNILPSQPTSMRLQPTVAGMQWDHENNFKFDRGLRLVLPEPTNVKTLDVALDSNDRYQLWVLHAEQGYVFVNTLGPAKGSGMSLYSMTIDQTKFGVTEFILIPTKGDGRYSVGHFLINKQ